MNAIVGSWHKAMIRSTAASQSQDIKDNQIWKDKQGLRMRRLFDCKSEKWPPILSSFES
jgi:hypothetical protein